MLLFAGVRRGCLKSREYAYVSWCEARGLNSRDYVCWCETKGLKRRDNAYLLGKAAMDLLFLQQFSLQFLSYNVFVLGAGARLSTTPGLCVEKVESD